MLTAVMNDMRGPEPTNAMGGAVEPVIGKIIENESNRHQPQRIDPTDLEIKQAMFVNP